MYEVICDGCGCTTQVPFQPKGDRPVYCRECFERNLQSAVLRAETKRPFRKERSFFRPLLPPANGHCAFPGNML